MTGARIAGQALVFGLTLTAMVALADAPAPAPSRAPSPPFGAGERLAFKMTYAHLLAGRARSRSRRANTRAGPCSG